jgi:hypothetical protein
MIPDYDKKIQPNPMPFFLHENMEFTSDILGIRVSFLWQPLINKNVINIVREWISYNLSERPYVILMSKFEFQFIIRSISSMKSSKMCFLD